MKQFNVPEKGMIEVTVTFESGARTAKHVISRHAERRCYRRGRIGKNLTPFGKTTMTPFPGDEILDGTTRSARFREDVFPVAMAVPSPPGVWTEGRLEVGNPGGFGMGAQAGRPKQFSDQTPN